MPRSVVDLTVSLRDRYHEAHLRDVEQLRELAHALGLPGLALEVEALSALLEVHLFREICVVHPKLRSEGGPGVLSQLVASMDEEHRRIDAAARSLAASIQSLEASLHGACPEDLERFLAISRRFLSELAEHRSVEDGELYAQFDHCRDRPA